MELLFRKRISRLEIAGRHVWIQSSSHLPQISQTDFTTLLEKHIETSLEKEFAQTLEKEFEKEVNHELQTLFKDLLDTEIKNLAKSVSQQFQKQISSSPSDPKKIFSTPLKKARENRTTMQSAAGGVNK